MDKFVVMARAIARERVSALAAAVQAYFREVDRTLARRPYADLCLNESSATPIDGFSENRIIGFSDFRHSPNRELWIGWPVQAHVLAAFTPWPVSKDGGSGGA
jgi:hypothetical protein